MKKSEFVKEMAALYRKLGWGDNQAETQAMRDAVRNHIEGLVTWDPEEPEVLWEGPEIAGQSAPARLTAEGKWQYRSGESWFPHPQEGTLVYRELARRILEEKRAEEELDDAMDAAEARLMEDLRKLEERGNREHALRDLKASFEGGFAGLDRIVGTTIVDDEHYRNLVALWGLWGPGGTLRKKLVDWTAEELYCAGRSTIHQLLSELLALPWEVMK